MKKIIPLVALLLAGGYFFWVKSQSDTHGPTAQQRAPVAPLDKTLPENNSAEKTTPTSVSDEPVESVEDVEKNLWTESELARQVLQESGRLPVDLNGETYLEIDVATLRNLAIGDYLDITLPGVGGSYDAQVGDIEEHASGNKSLQMNFPGLTRLHGATFTLGKDTVYAQLNLPSGSYTLEAQGGYAWIAPNGALIQNHVEKHDQDLSSEAPREKSFGEQDLPLNDFD
ncbi:hypothetical protein [Microbulbifer spongiae]|uniref:Uncharacterized protein n=1 Tax=Microbulbifer spongiae TaxID=2944933 RepID=A0ABY9EAW7_9GAMM|nr:hypothetical protein [Microbulbifer sp. MI-G]WKD48604.1 hypothetical protein M8T91_11810 [Microbulbifer sp. MI-G]